MSFPAPIKKRGEPIAPGDIVNLVAQFYDPYGNPTNLDNGSLPTISIIQPTGLVAMPGTSSGVCQIDVGKYLYQFQIPLNQANYGVFQDIWAGSVDGSVITQTLSFVVVATELPSLLSSDGYKTFVNLGDDPGFQYSQVEILNINKLLKVLNVRLSNKGKAQNVDRSGNIIYVDCDVFSVDVMVTALASSLSGFNQVPFFTSYRFWDTPIIDQFLEILVEGASLYLLASQSLLEQGRSFSISDSGVGFTPPNMGELLNTQYTTLLNHYWDKLKYIKQSIRPGPIALGSMPILLSGMNPQLKRLQHLRARQIL